MDLLGAISQEESRCRNQDLFGDRVDSKICLHQAFPFRCAAESPRGFHAFVHSNDEDIYKLAT